MMPDPKNMAEHLKELGPDKTAEALCAAFVALSALCKQAPPEEAPPAPKSMAGIASEARVATSKKPEGAPWA